MLEKVRYKIANHFARKAVEQVETGEFKEIMKGLKNFKRSILVISPAKELQEFGERWNDMVAKHSEEWGVYQLPLFLLRPKKQPLLWRRERCVTHFSFFLLSLSGKEAFSWPEVPSWRAVFRTGSSRS